MIKWISLLPCITFATPLWTTHPPSGYQNDYFVGRGVHEYRAEAEQSALSDGVGMVVKSGVILVEASSELRSEVNETMGTDADRFSQRDRLLKEIKITGTATSVKGLRQVESFCEFKEAWNCWALVAVPKKKALPAPSALGRAWSPLWRSALVPGWGQFYRGDQGRTWLMLGSSLGSLGLTYGFHTSMVSADHSAYSARTQARRDYFNQQKSDMTLARNLSLMAFVGAYSWSLIDALVVKDPNFYVGIEPRLDGLRLSMVF